MPLDMMNLSIQAGINIVVTLVSVGLAFWAIQAIRWDLFIARPQSPQAKLLYIFLSILIGGAVSRFFMDYLAWSLWLKG